MQRGNFGEYRVAYHNTVHVVMPENHVERVSGYRTVSLFLPHHAPVP